MQAVVLGTEEMNYILQNLPNKINRRVLLSAFRSAAKPLVKEAKRKVPVSGKKAFATVHRHVQKRQVTTLTRVHKPGQLKRSIGTINSRSKQKPSVWVGPRKGNKFKDDGWYGHFVEFGTIKQPPQPFMKTAWDSTKQTVENSIGREIGASMQRFMEKHAPKYFN